MAATEVPDNLIVPFQLERAGVRGRLVRLGTVANRIVTQHAYPDSVSALLLEALALTAVLANPKKLDGGFTLQTKGDGPVGLLVADLMSSGRVRGYAKFDEEQLAAAEAAGSGAPVPRLLGGGHLALTVDPGKGERYQGIVPLDGADLADCVHAYFRQSEQIDTCVRLAAAPRDDAGWRAGGIILQRLPGESGSAGIDFARDEADDDWRRSVILMSSVRDDELLDPDLAPETLLFRLFHEDQVRVFLPTHLAFGCKCSREKVAHVLERFSQAERRDMSIDGEVVVNCEFCNQTYQFTDAEVAALPVGGTDSD